MPVRGRSLSPVGPHGPAWRRAGWLGGTTCLLAAAAAVPLALTPRPEALRVWDAYVHAVEARVEAGLARREGPFLVYETLDAATRSRAADELRRGNVFVAPMPRPPGVAHQAPGALLHHWVGAILVRGADVERLLRFVQDYDRHATTYRDVVASRLISREGDRFQVFLKLKRTKVLTAYYNTEHDVLYRRVAPGRAASRSVATRIAELDEATTPREREKPPSEDRGFLWRLNSYWRFQDVAEGVVAECESVSLSRDIPWMFRPIVQPFASSIPRESLERTLSDMRAGVLSR